MNASSTRRDAQAILLRMARDQARAERIRALKDAHPETTWDEIADYVGVSPRAANAWAAHGGIAPKNARKLAEMFDLDYRELYEGPAKASPDLMSKLRPNGRLENVERMLQGIEAMLQDVLARLPEEDLAAVIRDALDAPAAAPTSLPAPPRRAAGRRKAQAGRTGS